MKKMGDFTVVIAKDHLKQYNETNKPNIQVFHFEPPTLLGSYYGGSLGAHMYYVGLQNEKEEPICLLVKVVRTVDEEGKPDKDSNRENLAIENLKKELMKTKESSVLLKYFGVGLYAIADNGVRYIYFDLPQSTLASLLPRLREKENKEKGEETEIDKAWLQSVILVLLPGLKNILLGLSQAKVIHFEINPESIYIYSYKNNGETSYIPKLFNFESAEIYKDFTDKEFENKPIKPYIPIFAATEELRGRIEGVLYKEENSAEGTKSINKKKSMKAFETKDQEGEEETKHVPYAMLDSKVLLTYLSYYLEEAGFREDDEPRQTVKTMLEALSIKALMKLNTMADPSHITLLDDVFYPSAPKKM